MTCADCSRVATTPCVVCGAGLLDLLCLGNQPPANAYHEPGETQSPIYALHRAVCGTCGVEQAISRPHPDTLYQGYRYLSGANRRWRDHVATLAWNTMQGRSETAVVDIGSNDGSLLAAYKALGAEVWGVDPCKELAEQATELGLPTINGYLDEETATVLAGQADIIHAHNVWGHLPDPAEAATNLAKMLKPGGQIIIETPWLAQTVHNVEFDTLYHEHRTTWTLRAIEQTLAKAGLWVFRAESLPIHGGSLRVYAGIDGASDGSLGGLLKQESDVLGAGWRDGFADGVQTFAAGVAAWLRSAHAAGVTVAAYGAAAKATVLLHSIGDTRDLLAFVVDDAPAKQGLCMPGTDLEILEPDRLMLERPDAVLVLAWNWADAIAEQGAADYLRDGGILAVPDPHHPSQVRVIGGPVA